MQWTAVYFSNTNIYVSTEVFTVDSVKATLWFPTLDAATTNRTQLEADLKLQVGNSNPENSSSRSRLR